MANSPEAPAVVLQPSYARALDRPTLTRRRVLTSLAVIAALIAPVYMAWAFGWLGRVFKPGAAAANVHEVRPSDLSITLTENGELKPKDSAEIKCEVEGQSTILFVVAESTRVKKGDLLVELASDEHREKLDAEEIELRKIRADLEAATQDLSITKNEAASKLKKCQIDLDVAKLDLRQYIEGEFEKSLKAADIDIQQTQLDIKRKEDELEKNEKLAARGFVTATKLEELRFELQKARMSLEKNELAKHILLEYDRPKSEKQKVSAVDQASEELARETQRANSREKQAIAKVEAQTGLLNMREGRLTRLRKAVEKCKIFANVDGLVQYPSGDSMWRMGGNRVAAGEKVFEGQTLLVLPDTSQMLVSTRIHEADRHRVREGLRCVVTVPAVPGHSFSGSISKITQFADSANRWLNPELKEHTTEILLDQTDAPVSPGDSAEIKILIEEVPNVLAVPVQSVFARGSRSFVFVQDGASARVAEVKVGRSSTTLIEVCSGLSGGDKVLLHADDALLAMLPAAAPDKEAPASEPKLAAPKPAGGPGGKRAERSGKSG